MKKLKDRKVKNLSNVTQQVSREITESSEYSFGGPILIKPLCCEM